MAVYHGSPAALSWLISLSVSLGHLLITNQKASLTSHKRRRTGADSERRAATFRAKINKRRLVRVIVRMAGPRREQLRGEKQNDVEWLSIAVSTL